MANHTIDCDGCGVDLRAHTWHDEKACIAKNSPQENFVASDERACPNCGAAVSSLEYAEDVSNYFTDIKIEDGTYCINPEAQAIFWDAATEQRLFCTECDHYFDLDNMEIDFR